MRGARLESTGLDEAITAEVDVSAVHAHLGRRAIVVLRDGAAPESHPLPHGAVWVVGRGAGCELLVDDPTISRRHAILHVGTHVEIEDLGSVNGTRVREPLEGSADSSSVELVERQILGRERLQPGAIVLLGAVSLVVQTFVPVERPRAIFPHGYFEACVEKECARARRSRGSFAIARIALEGTVRTRDAERALVRATRSCDVLGTYGPNEWEVLLVDADQGQIAEIAALFEVRLAALGVRTRVAVVRYPDDGRDPESLLARAGEALRGELPEGRLPRVVVLEDAAMKRLYRVVERVADSDISVLLVGETGVGKDVVAEALHGLSPRKSGPFLRLNCAALTESLLESELFGHERGAFTGATQTKPGLLETASGGTVFLDEVGELPTALQAKLLRALEEGQVRRVGGLRAIAIDVRFVAATNRDLEAEVARATFRSDLFFRLAGVTFAIPPLRDRPTEILPLARAFLRDLAARRGRPAPVLTEAAAMLVQRYAWPGNIRELRNAMERAMLLAEGAFVDEDDLPVEKMGAGWPMRATEPPLARADDLKAQLHEEERKRVLGALEACGGNQTQAARKLGIARGTLIARLEAFGVPRPRKT